jgi:flagellar motor switch protein FliG
MNISSKTAHLFYSDEEFKSTQSMDVDNKERNIVTRHRKLKQKHFEL